MESLLLNNQLCFPAQDRLNYLLHCHTDMKKQLQRNERKLSIFHQNI